MRHLGLILTLIVGLILSGLVPEGMMRVGGAQGMTLVLCTAEGPRELRIGPDGTPQDNGPAPSEHGVSDCLAVSLSLAAVQSGFAPVPVAARFASFRPALSARPPVRAPLPEANPPRAPPRAA